MSSNSEFDQSYDSAIAIIGMGLRFPGARTVAEYWANLRAGVESVSELSAEELERAGVTAAEQADPQYVKVVPEKLFAMESFDAGFFGFSPREALLTDPQQRVLLETAWEALESAGYDVERYAGAIGVWAGAGVNRYLLENLLPEREWLAEEVGGLQVWLGNEKDFLSTRVSYKLNLHGPSMSVSTACSTSLVAVHLACQSLLSGECEMALAGGVSLRVPERSGYRYQPGGVYSPDGHCRPFDERAGGTMFGSGAGLVVLKRVADAVRDGDTIWAVLRGTAINNDGGRKVGYTAPSVQGQSAVIAEALALAQVEAGTIGYVEAHGTGTELGDPIELAALSEVFGAAGEAERRCALGSVKANFGHLDTAAGVAGLLKVVLALKHGEKPPQVNYERANGGLDLGRGGFYVNVELERWESEVRRAGVSSFGIGGTNAHVVVESWGGAATEEAREREWQLLLLSGRSEAALERQSEQLASYLSGADRASLADVAYTLAVGRKRFSERRYVVCRNYEEALAGLAGESVTAAPGPASTDDPSLVFMFPGGGSQYVNMGRELYETEPYFREQVDICAELLATQSGHALLEFLYPQPEAVEEAAVSLKKTPVALPALFVIEYALAKLWMSWGLNPSAMIGHSLGEYVAACLAGVFSLEDALALVLHRARLLTELLPGVMLSVPLPEHEIKELIDGRLSLAAVNGPSQCVVSGPIATIDELAALLEKREIDFHRLKIDAPGHSEMVNPILEPFAEFVRGLNLRAPSLPYISNVTGTWITDQQATDPEYWAAHLRQTVRFSEGINELLKDPAQHVFLEVGPGQTLCSLVKLNSGEHSSRVISSLRHPREQRNDVEFLLSSLGRLWQLGARISFDNFFGKGCHRTPLPTYPFERQRYWMEPAENGARGNSTLRKQADVADWFFCPAWKRSSWLGLSSRASVKESWLIFLDSAGIGSQLAQRLREQGQQVSTVSPGHEFAASDGDNYSVRPAVANDYNALIEDLDRRDLLPRKLVHLWGVTTTEMSEPEDSKDKGFYSLLWLAQAFGHRQSSDQVHWTVVTNGVQVVAGDEDTSPMKAMALGLCKVIPQEYPNISCRGIDLLLNESTGAQAKLIERLVQECVGNKTGETMVAYRGSYRWVEVFEPVRIEAPLDEQSQLRERGVYLITGGLGQVGLSLADYLARTVRARLALIGRTELPARSLWDQYIRTHDEADHGALAIRQLIQLEEHGAEVLFISADVANEEQMREAVALVRNKFQGLHGVLHCAGVKIFKTVQEIEREECEEQFRAKVDGVLTLEKVLDDCELDFCLLASSLASVLGVVSLAAYPAAHIYLDAFVHQHNQTHSTPWMSIGWDNWGAALGTGKRSDESALFMKREEADKVLDRIFSLEPVSRLLVSTADLETRVNKWIKRGGRSERRTFDSQLSHVEAESHSRPVLRKSYVAPRNEVEKTLAAIWQQSLGIAQVGTADNYFDLGGDSVLAIHIVARAKQQGISLAPKQLFYHQTIAELALAARTGPTTLASQETVTGEVFLTPIQRWFFEQDLSDPHHWNLALWLEARERPSVAILAAMVRSLLAHHDALRMRFELRETEWKQLNPGLDESTPVIWLDLSGLPQTSRKLVMERAANQLQTSLHLHEGPLLRLAHFDLGEEQSGRLLLILHHLVMDAVSLRILLDDMQKTFRQLMQGQSIDLPAKTTSFQRWAECLSEYARCERLEKESDYWLSLPWDEIRPLPLDHQRGPNTYASTQTISVSLKVEQTRSLLQSLPRDLNVKINDLLLTALARSLWSWTESSAVLIDLEGHGREDITEGIDLSRTVGWFTTTAPLILRRAGGKSESIVEQLKLVKDEFGATPLNGIGFGVLRYLGEPSLADRLRALPQAQLSFVYLGQFDHVLPEASPFVIASESVGATRSPASVRAYLIEVVSLVRGGQLHVNWIYSENFHSRATVENLARRFQESLEELIAAAESTTQVIYTPADFPGAELSQEQLDEIMARIN